MAELVAAGKVRYLGLSEAAPSTIRRGARRAPDHRAADRVLVCGRAIPRTRSCPPLRELGIGFVPYSPLGRGFLTGDDPLARRPRRGRLPPRAAALRRATTSSANIAIVERIDAVAGGAAAPRRRRSRWRGCMRRGDDVVPIPGTKRRTYLEENVGRRRPRAERGRAGTDQRRGHGERRSVRRHELRRPLTRAPDGRRRRAVRQVKVPWTMLTPGRVAGGTSRSSETR